MTGLVYRNQALYELIMMLLYRQHYGDRYRAIADLVPAGSSVLDVCCGPGVLYTRYLKLKDVQYTGLDLNETFVARLRSAGINAIHADIKKLAEWPQADIAVIQASLYHFLPDDAGGIIGKLMRAARRKVIIAEPVRNLSSLKLKWLARWVHRLTDAGSGAESRRYDEQSLGREMAPFASAIERSFTVAGGREMVYVLRK
jgi:SAM-dependent methyltransferase